MGSSSNLNPVNGRDDWQYLRAMLIAYDLVVGDQPSGLARELFDEALLLARVKCGEDVSWDTDTDSAR